MHSPRQTLEELWARQQICGPDVDYDGWRRKRQALRQFSRIGSQCLFTVDVFRGVYDFASESFGDIFGFKRQWLKTIERQGDLIEEQIHPADRDRLLDLQIRHSRFIYSLDARQRNDYMTIYQCRMRNSANRYINVTSRQQVIETDRNGKAWIVLGRMEPSADQTPPDTVKSAVMNLGTGCLLDPYAAAPEPILTRRELEILRLIRQGWLSKEIAGKLKLSIHTIHNHRKHILAKLDADNAVEAINRARNAGLID